MRILGIDEAGRGPVLGPLVMAGALIEKKSERQLKRLGVKDSKLLTAEKRKDIQEKMTKHLIASRVIAVSNQELDDMMSSGINLNAVEACTTARLINMLRPDVVILDCPSRNIVAYTREIRRHLDAPDVEIRAEFHADMKYVVVGAASILAKVRRDAEIEAFKEKFGIDCGSGYMTDPLTERFLRENYARYPIFRKMWEPWKRISREQEQTTLMVE
jgi:ribonuclease HII